MKTKIVNVFIVALIACSPIQTDNRRTASEVSERPIAGVHDGGAESEFEELLEAIVSTSADAKQRVLRIRDRSASGSKTHLAADYVLRNWNDERGGFFSAAPVAFGNFCPPAQKLGGDSVDRPLAMIRIVIEVDRGGKPSVLRIDPPLRRGLDDAVRAQLNEIRFIPAKPQASYEVAEIHGACMIDRFE